MSARLVRCDASHLNLSYVGAALLMRPKIACFLGGRGGGWGVGGGGYGALPQPTGRDQNNAGGHVMWRVGSVVPYLVLVSDFVQLPASLLLV